MTGYYRRDGRYIEASPSGSSRVRASGLVVLPSERRKNGIGISNELPTWRSIAWNVVFLGFEGCLIIWAHFVVGVAWSTIGAGFAIVIAFGIALITYAVKVHTPRAIRRHHELLRSFQAAAAAHDEVVDRQSPPRPSAPSPTAPSIGQASRAH